MPIRTGYAFRNVTAVASRRDRVASGAITLLLHVGLIGWWLHAGAQGSWGRDSAGVDGGDNLVVEYIQIDDRRDKAVEPAEATVEAEATLESDASASEPAAIPEQTALKVEDGELPPLRDGGAQPIAHAEAATPQAAASAAASAGAAGDPDDDLAARYRAALRARIGAMWTSLTNTALPGECALAISQQAGGALVSAKAVGCKLDAAAQRQLEAAALMAQPLPYAGYEPVFAADLELAL